MPLPSGKARHPRSRVERQALDELTRSLSTAMDICNSGAGDDALRLLAATSRKSAIAGSSQASARMQNPALASNGGSRPSLFYAPPPVSGIGLSSNGDPRAVLSAEDDTVLRHYGVQQLSEYARHELLGSVSDYLPSYREEAAARTRFNQLLCRIQQHQLARTVQNELRAKRQPTGWDERRFHLAPMTIGSKRAVPVHAWAEFIRKGGDPASADLGLDIVPDILAERHIPTTGGAMQATW